MTETTDTAEISKESLEILRDEAQSFVDSIDDEEWQESPYGKSVVEAIENAEEALEE